MKNMKSIAGESYEKRKFDWLPKGWTVKTKKRMSGESAGNIDKYYVEEKTSKRFRSKKEVQRYLEKTIVANPQPEVLQDHKMWQPKSMSWTKSRFGMNFEGIPYVNGMIKREEIQKVWAEVFDKLLGGPSN